MSGYGGV
jgi:hypothetical protein